MAAYSERKLREMERLRTVVMGNSDYEISLATPNDVPAIFNLQAQNLRSNGGALSVRFSGEWFEKAIAEMPIVVAHMDGNVVGYVVSTPLAAQAHEPIIQSHAACISRLYRGL
jgi:predicted N-acetyltransferase YhbS